MQEFCLIVEIFIVYLVYCFARTIITKYYRLSGLKLRNVFSHQLESGSPGSRYQQVCFSLRLFGLQTLRQCNGLVQFHKAVLLCMCTPSVFLCVLIYSYKDNSHMDEGPPLQSHFDSIISLNTLSPNTVTC